MNKVEKVPNISSKMLNGMNERLPTPYIFVHAEYHAIMPRGRTNVDKARTLCIILQHDIDV